jgi:hypothetical protein
VGWALFWVGLIVAFPYSRRVRAVYLFNDKLRGALSLWFVPLILTVVPAPGGICSGEIDTGTLAGFGPAAMMANDNDLIRSSPFPA